jgi:hypothetical protein
VPTVQTEGDKFVKPSTHFLTINTPSVRALMAPVIKCADTCV